MSRPAEPPRRQPRRGDQVPRGGSAQGAGAADGPQRESGGRGARNAISDARAYTPRARTVREAPELRGRPARDPLRPVLQVVDGGRQGEPARNRRDAGSRAGRTAGGGTPKRAAAGGNAATRTRQAAPEPRATTAPRRRPAGGRTPGSSRARPEGRGAGRVSASRPPRSIGPPRLADAARRLRLGTLLALGLFAVIGLRLVALQITEAPAYAAEGLADRLTSRVLPAPRGSIYDRNGAVLAHSVEARYVYSDPSRVVDPERTAEALSPLLGIAKSELVPRLVKQNRPDGRPSQFEWLARGVSVETADSITALNLAGIGVARDERREVPGHDLAANLIGFVGEDVSGLEGLEARHDELLRGVNGELTYEQGQGELAAGIPGGYRRETPAQPGTSLRLTIDRDLQYEVQRILSAKMRACRATFGAAIVLDVRSGEVLAQASYPTYDAANPLKARPTDRADAATAVVVDPGSVHKPLIVAAALQEGKIKPDSTVTVAPAIRKGDTRIPDTHPFRSGTRITLPTLLAYSSNVGTIKLADMIGADQVYAYQRRFGLGEPTGVGVPGEAPGLVQPPKNWSGSSYGSIPIGLGVAVTPMQMASAFAAIANDGTWLRPHLVKATISADGTERPAARAESRRVLSPENAKALRTMLEAVTTVDGATGTTAAIPGYRVAGKTGTGQRVVDGEYVPGEVASFVGMAPAENPRYVIAVFAHTPGGTGGVVAGPAFRDMMELALRHYRVPPTGTKPPKFDVRP
jgi:cell division protein FtsI (penicillin-binding protein 3)